MLRMLGVPRAVRAVRPRITEHEFSAQALTLLSPSTCFLFCCFPTPLESQIQLGPGNRGDDPRFFLLGLHHHPDSGRLHRFSAGRQQVKHRARRGLGEVGLIPSEGQRRPRAGATAPRGWGTPGRGLLVPWNPLAGLEHCASFQNKAPQRIWVFHGGRTLSPPPPCPGVTCFSRNGRRASVAARG